MLAGDHFKGLPAPSSFCFVLGVAAEGKLGDWRERELVIGVFVG